jgi:hypothetical protein
MGQLDSQLVHSPALHEREARLGEVQRVALVTLHDVVPLLGFTRQPPEQTVRGLRRRRLYLLLSAAAVGSVTVVFCGGGGGGGGVVAGSLE